MSREMRCFVAVEREGENLHGSWRVDWSCKGPHLPLNLLVVLEPRLPLPVYSSTTCYILSRLASPGSPIQRMFRKR